MRLFCFLLNLLQKLKKQKLILYSSESLQQPNYTQLYSAMTLSFTSQVTTGPVLSCWSQHRHPSNMSLLFLCFRPSSLPSFGLPLRIHFLYNLSASDLFHLATSTISEHTHAHAGTNTHFLRIHIAFGGAVE